MFLSPVPKREPSLAILGLFRFIPLDRHKAVQSPRLRAQFSQASRWRMGGRSGEEAQP